MLKVFANHKHKTSILDDFGFYEKRQELMEDRKNGNNTNGNAPAQVQMQ